MDGLILVANPGSASRKYGLYQNSDCLAKIHFEHEDGRIIYTFAAAGQAPTKQTTKLSHLTFAPTQVWEILVANYVDLVKDEILAIALRIVAPASYFQKDRLLNRQALTKLGELEKRAPLHINALLAEIKLLAKSFPKAKLVGISDSGFHLTKPEVASDYALPPAAARRLDIRRFGYHGLSVESAVSQLTTAEKLPSRLVVCHLGSGSSVTAVKKGRSLDNTMGYSPLSGLMMATRAGDLDIAAALALKSDLKLDDHSLQTYLNEKSGLLGVSGRSSDIRQLLELEERGNATAKLALDMYVYHICQAVGQMTAVLGGLDGLVFTGVVGERSAEIRRRIVAKLSYLGLMLDARTNHHLDDTEPLVLISPKHHPAKIYVITADEAGIMAARAKKLVG